MCGIAGFIDPSLAGENPRHLVDHVLQMNEALLHRGPDGGAHWVSSEMGAGMGFRRLAIIDLSDNGMQPMTSSCGRYVITFNGEIYNFENLREVLYREGRRFRGKSDTEVILEGISAWGVEKTLSLLIGMFAIALWDKRAKRMTLIRDRLGIKPLYWGLCDGIFLYGSELKALRAKTGWTAKLNRQALTAYLRYNYVPAPLSIYENIAQLPPGHMLTYAPETDAAPQIIPYWDFTEFASVKRREVNVPAASKKLEELLLDAVGRRMVADVPLGVMLSGGVDSATVAALMQAQSNRPIQSFTIGFENKGYDEAPHAAAIAAHLGADHTELILTEDRVRDLIPNLPDWYDEPFADSSALPTWLVSNLARDTVTVALSGDGGDEVFFGYNRYRAASKAWARATSTPRFLRHTAAGLARGLSTSAWDGLSSAIPKGARPRMFGDKMHKLADLLTSDSPDNAYLSLISHWTDPESLTGTPEPVLESWEQGQALSDFTERMAYYDTRGYLPGDILTKVDRASMATSLEARVPLLDHRVVEFAWTLPKSAKMQGSVGKYILRNVLYKYVPKTLIERPKAGFALPLADWLRGPLRDWAETLIAPERLKTDGILRPQPIIDAWQNHQKGKGNHAEALWNILMFQAWKDRWDPAL